MEGINSASSNSPLTQGEKVKDQETSPGLSTPLLAVLYGYLRHPAHGEARRLLVETLIGKATLDPPVQPKGIPIEYGLSGITLPSFVIDNPSFRVEDLINHIEKHSSGFGSIKVFIRGIKKELNKSALIVDILKQHPDPVIEFVRHVACAGIPFSLKKGQQLNQPVILGKGKTEMTIKFTDESIDPFTTFTAGSLYSLCDNEYFQEIVNIQNMKNREPDETFLEIKKDEAYFIETVKVTDVDIIFRAHYLIFNLSEFEIAYPVDLDKNESEYKKYIVETKDPNCIPRTTFHLPCTLDRHKCYLEITIQSLEFDDRCADGLIDYSVVDRETGEGTECLWIYSMDGKKILNVSDLFDISYVDGYSDESGSYNQEVTVRLKQRPRLP